MGFPSPRGTNLRLTASSATRRAGSKQARPWGGLPRHTATQTLFLALVEHFRCTWPLPLSYSARSKPPCW